jgi:transcriptional regulator with XRE-family HTH domain
MSPRRFSVPHTDRDADELKKLWLKVAIDIGDARRSRRWSMAHLARLAGVSRTVVVDLEGGRTCSVEAVYRVCGALGLRLELELVDSRKRADQPIRTADSVHSFMGEFEARHLRALGYPIGMDEPYQHYHFAGRGDVVAWDPDARALLHLENRTRFPDLQEMAGSFNSKRAYLGETLGARIGIRRWASQTHVIVALWSAEVLHVLRLRPESFRAICPDPTDGFESWWSGRPVTAGLSSTLVLLDPLAVGRQRRFIRLEEAIVGAKPRHRGYADVAAKLDRLAESS